MRANLGVAQALCAQRFHIGGLCGLVILANEVGAVLPICCTGPVFVQLGRNRLELALVAAVVADQNHIGEAMLFEAAGCRVEQAFERFVGNGDRAGEAHVGRGRCDVALRHIRHHRRHQRIAQRVGNPTRQHLHPHIVFAQHHVRPVLFGASHRNDERGFACALRIAHFDPSHFFDERGGGNGMRSSCQQANRDNRESRNQLTHRLQHQRALRGMKCSTDSLGL